MTKLLSGKTTLLAVAFLVGAVSMTAVGASAFGGANLTEEQKDVMEEVRSLHEAGDHEEARALLEVSGIDMKSLHRRFKGDFSELTDEQKSALKEARILGESGDKEGAKALLEEAGIKFHPRMGMGEDRPELTDEQKSVLDEVKLLMESGDREAAKDLLDKAGIRPPHKRAHGEWKSELKKQS